MCTGGQGSREGAERQAGRGGGDGHGRRGAGQVLQLGVGRDLGREVLDGHAGVQAVGVDLVQVSQVRGTAQGLTAQHPGRWTERGQQVITGTRMGYEDLPWVGDKLGYYILIY